MPVITVVGMRFQISSDFVPFLALLGFATHTIYFIIFGVIFLLSKPGSCSSEGSSTSKAYASVLDGTLAIFGLTMLLEIVLFFIGIQGTPFQESKRRWMVPSLYVRAAVWIMQASFNVYATVVVEHPGTPECFTQSGRHVDLRVMVYMTWAFILFNWVRVYIVYVLFPDYQDAQSWRRHARIIVFGCFKNKDSRDIQEQLKNEGKKPLKRTTRVFANMVKHLDLSPTDQVVGLILLGALQRRRRGIHISALLRPEVQPNHTSLAELQAARGTSLDLQGNNFEGRMERALTRGASTEGDLTAVLKGLRETRSEVEAVLISDPEAARKLAIEGAHATIENGVLSQTATRVLGATTSFKRTDEPSKSSEALHRMGSFSMASGPELVAAMGVAATTAPALDNSSSCSDDASNHVDVSPEETCPAVSIPLDSCQPGTSGDSTSASDPSLARPDPGDDESRLRLRGGSGQAASSPTNGMPPVVPTNIPAGPVVETDPAAVRNPEAVTNPAAMSQSAGLGDGSVGHGSPGLHNSTRHSVRVVHTKAPIAAAHLPAGTHGAQKLTLPASAVIGSRSGGPKGGYVGGSDLARSEVSDKGKGVFPFSLKSRSMFGKSRVGGIKPSASSNNSLRSETQSEADREHEQVLAEALAETDPEKSKMAAQAELALSPEQSRPNLDALSKIQARSKAQGGRRAPSQVPGLKEGRPADGSSGRGAEEGPSLSSPSARKQGVIVSEEDQTAETARAGAIAAAQEARETVEAAGLNKPDANPSKHDVRNVARAAVDLLEAQLGTALTTIQQRVAAGTHTGEQTAAEVGHHIALSNLDTFLTPSSIAAELRPDLSPAKAADIYTGRHKQVDRDTTLEARIFAKYATAVYGSSFAVWLDGSNKYIAWARLLLHRGWNAYKANELNASRITTLGEHIDYEAIIQYSGIDDNDLLYFSYTNQALGVLPYIVVLDHATKSVVVAIRGSASTADWVTDFMGVPEDAAAWIPDSFREEHPNLGACTAHSGMLIAASAVWADLEKHGILSTLLNPPKDSDDSSMHSEHSEVPATQQQHSPSQQQQQQGSNRNMGRLEANRGSVDFGDHNTGNANAATRTSASGGSFQEGAPCEVRPRSDTSANKAEDGARGPEDVSRKTGQLKDSADSNERRGPYVAAIMKRGLHKQGWKLVVTGHSLGAGVAALISLKLRNAFPEVRCWSFCPPGGLVSANLSAAMAPWCTSVICGKDAISRISLPNLAGLIDETLIAIARCKQPTCQVLLNTMRKSTRAQTIDKLLFAPEDVPDEALNRLHHYQALKPQEQELLLPMLPPGRAIFLRRLKAKVDRKERRAQIRAAKAAAAYELKEQRRAAKIRRLAEKRERQREAMEQRAATRAQGSMRVASRKLHQAEPFLGVALQRGISAPLPRNTGHSRGREVRQASTSSRAASVAPPKEGERDSAGLEVGKSGCRADSRSRSLREKAAVGKSRLGLVGTAATVAQNSGTCATATSASESALGTGEHLTAIEERPPWSGSSGGATSPFANSSAQGEPHQETAGRRQSVTSDRQVHGDHSDNLVRHPSDAASVISVLSTDTEGEGDVRIDVMSDTETDEDETGGGAASGKWLYERRWDAVWIHPKEVVNEGILISPRMTSDHYTTSLIGALQAVLSGGRETGTLEQQAGGAKPAARHTPIDRLKSLAAQSDSESFSAMSDESAYASAASASGRHAPDTAVDIGGSSFNRRKRATGIASVGAGNPPVPQPGRSHTDRGGHSMQGGEARNAVLDIMPG